MYMLHYSTALILTKILVGMHSNMIPAFNLHQAGYTVGIAEAPGQCHDDVWRVVRRAWQSSFVARSLSPRSYY